MSPFLSLVLIALLAVSGSVASPLKERSMDSSLFATFNLMEQYAAAGYCSSNHNSAGDKISCKSGNCPLAQAAQASSVLEFEFDMNDPTTTSTGYVAVDDINRLIIISFRGSYSLEDWTTNLDLDLVGTNLCNGCTAHDGFWKSWLKARDQVTAAVQKTLQSHVGYQIVSTGHSLGGALATLAAADLRNNGYTVALYSFGAPRAAGLKLSAYISAQPGGNYRVTHWNDLVPQLPPVWLGYAHISPEYYIKKANNKAVAASDVQVYTGYTNWWGNAIFVGNGGWLTPDIGAHLWYFNNIVACGLGKKRGLNGDLNVVASF